MDQTQKTETIKIDNQDAQIVKENHAPEQAVILNDPSKANLEEFLPILFALRTTFKTRSTIPSYVPRNFTEQFVLYANGTTFRLYIYIVGTGWKYTNLT